MGATPYRNLSLISLSAAIIALSNLPQERLDLWLFTQSFCRHLELFNSTESRLSMETSKLL